MALRIVLDKRGWEPVYPLDHSPIVDQLECEVECASCEHWIPHPYLDDDLDETEYVCSTCDAEQQERRRLQRLREEHTPTEALPPAICECGFTLDKCTAGTCKGPAPIQGRLL